MYNYKFRFGFVSSKERCVFVKIELETQAPETKRILLLPREQDDCAVKKKKIIRCIVQFAQKYYTAEMLLALNIFRSESTLQ